MLSFVLSISINRFDRFDRFDVRGSIAAATKHKNLGEGCELSAWRWHILNIRFTPTCIQGRSHPATLSTILFCIQRHSGETYKFVDWDGNSQFKRKPTRANKRLSHLDKISALVLWQTNSTQLHKGSRAAHQVLGCITPARLGVSQCFRLSRLHPSFHRFNEAVLTCASTCVFISLCQVAVLAVDQLPLVPVQTHIVTLVSTCSKYTCSKYM